MTSAALQPGLAPPSPAASGFTTRDRSHKNPHEPVKRARCTTGSKGGLPVHGGQVGTYEGLPGQGAAQADRRADRHLPHSHPAPMLFCRCCSVGRRGRDGPVARFLHCKESGLTRACGHREENTELATVKNALIVGGGPAGLCAGTALCKRGVAVAYGGVHAG